MSELHPVQNNRLVKRDNVVSSCITKRAYEVYKHRYGNAQSLERLNERGGFSVGELISLLYARSFPKEGWSSRDAEAMRGMKI